MLFQTTGFVFNTTRKGAEGASFLDTQQLAMEGECEVLPFLDDLKTELVAEKRLAKNGVVPHGIQDARALPLEHGRIRRFLSLMALAEADACAIERVKLAHSVYFYNGERAAVDSLLVALYIVRCAITMDELPFWADSYACPRLVL